MSIKHLYVSSECYPIMSNRKLKVRQIFFLKGGEGWKLETSLFLRLSDDNHPVYSTFLIPCIFILEVVRSISCGMLQFICSFFYKAFFYCLLPPLHQKMIDFWLCTLYLYHKLDKMSREKWLTDAIMLSSLKACW